MGYSVEIALTSAQFQQSYYYLIKASTSGRIMVMAISQNTLGLPDMVQQTAALLKWMIFLWGEKKETCGNRFSAEHIEHPVS